MEEASLRNVVGAKLNEFRTRLFVTPHYQRSFHAFCLGMEKTGTHSMAALLAADFRSDHEPDYPSLIRRIVRADGSWQSLPASELRARDRRLWLELESCWLQVFNVRELVETFPRAQFILTVRDCYSWLESLTNHVLAYDVGPHWRRAQEAYYRPGAFEYSTGEEAFEEAGLYPLGAYLTAWSWHNRRVLDAVPEERLLVVPTSRIKQSADQIGSFLGISAERVDVERGHQYANHRKFHMLEKIDGRLLDDSVAELCGDLMRRWFPDVVEGRRGSRDGAADGRDPIVDFD